MPTLVGKITDHFSWHEAECHSKPPVPVPDEFRHNARNVCLELEKIRRLCGAKPLTVTRIYSTPQHNAAVGGAPHSHHLYANAADILPPIKGMTARELAQVVYVLSQQADSRVRYIRAYGDDGHVHFDLRPRASVLTEGF